VTIACALCGAADTRRIYTKFDYGIERCRRCGLVYANPRADAARILSRYSRDYFWNEYLPAAGAAGGTIDYATIDGRSGALLELIRRHAPEARRMLEVGAGAGFFLKGAERAGWTVAGVELSADAAAFARERLALDVREARAEEIPFDPGSFEVAVMIEVIEHLFDPAVALAAVRQVLVPDGLLLITTPNFNALSRYVLGVDWSILSPLEHMYYFTHDTLGRLLTRCGFEVIEARPIVRIQPDWLMNAKATHRPGRRSRWYKRFVEDHDRWLEKYGFNLSVWIQMRGLADGLVMIARKSK
jgi:SAM-dependent methyltransferase